MRLSTLLFLFAAPAPAQEVPEPPPVHLPTLARTGNSAAAFAPKGWIVQIQATGDLNGDGLPDLAFVLHSTSKRNILSNPSGFGVDPIDTNPRILAVAFHNPTGDGYTLALQNGTLIPRYTAPNMDDNFDVENGNSGGSGGLSIAHGTFTVGLYYFANMGSWNTGTTSFTFRYQNNRFELIGYDNNDLHRGTGVQTDTSVNFSTGKIKITTGSDTTRTRTAWKTLKSTRHLTVADVGDGMDFTPN